MEFSPLMLALAQDAALAADIEALSALCRRVLDEEFGRFAERLGTRRCTPEEWFSLLQGHPHRPAVVAELAALVAAARAMDDYTPGIAAKYVLVQAILAAAPRVPELAVDASIKRLFLAVYTRFAASRSAWADDFGAGHWELREAIQLVSLRRFPAGQHDWEASRVPLSAPLRLNPLSLPAFAATIAGMGGVGPVASLHLSPWRPDKLSLQRAETLRSYYRIARSMERQPQLRGLLGASWFYSEVVGHVSPHLAWLRDDLLQAGAFVGEMEPARAKDGFMTSPRRRQLYQDGRFRPRMTLVLWPRRAMLAWAQRHPELDC